MNTRVSLARALVFLAVLALALGYFRQRAFTRIASPPAQLQGESFSITDGDPLTATGVYPADVLGSGGYPLIICEDLGLDCNDLSGGVDEVLGLSYGLDFTLDDLPLVQFSVTPGGRGLAGTALRAEADCSPPEAGADVFESALDGANVQDLDGDGDPCSSNAGYTLGLTETVPADNLDALDLDPCLTVDDDCDGLPDQPVFLTLGFGSPTLASIGATPADILLVSGGFGAQLWAGAGSLGLIEGDVIDALCIYENGNGVFDDGDLLLFSLAASSPALAGIQASPADLLMPRPLRPLITAADLGLETSDDVDALLCGGISIPTQAVYLPLIRK